MIRDLTAQLTQWAENGGRRIGQILLSRAGVGWELRHHEDENRTDLTTYHHYEAARSVANLDDAGAYRPLKTAPNLCHGWRLELPDLSSVRLALDYFYPGMLGVWGAMRAGTLAAVHLRDTLGRQTGMYRVTQKITDPQAQQLVASACAPGCCSKIILWQLDSAQPIEGLPAEKLQAGAQDALPLYCHEACNLLVAAARKIVKGEAQAHG